eukprot:CAMPEP_0183538138 /NCGR_PEP_ID=MMETSP0371-20130417/29383_1 /TAXON_ID=268820 /ORGANISM="Peridinium aciculiferum, Strain PAER-2" /LENGTH=52 /DNA_ID=CAMNT_0025738933 /DNA_START=137 /DNA_END=291 /DNA_ORIENTATION=-
MTMQMKTTGNASITAKNAKMETMLATRQQLLLKDLAWPWACIAPKGTAGNRP